MHSMSTPGLPSSPAHCPECDPEFVAPPTATLYYLRSRRRPNTNFIRAEITPADYLVYDVENTPDDGLGCPGPWLFEMAWDHFVQSGANIQGIRGSWTFGTNLATVNALTTNSQTSLEDAAKQTWAFARAAGKGFMTVQVLDSDGTPGNYNSVDVVFLP
jgi:hypothetical protein